LKKDKSSQCIIKKLKNKIIFSFLLVSFSGLLIPPGPAFAESPIPDSEPQCLPIYNIAGIDYELEFEEFIKNLNEQGEWKQIRCSYEAPDDAILPTGTPFSAVFNAIYTDTLMKNPNDLCDRSGIASESVALTFFYDNLSAQIWSTDHVAYWKVSRADIEAQAYNQLDVIANFADTCWEEIEKEFDVFDEPEKECEPKESSNAGKLAGFAGHTLEGAILKHYGSSEWVPLKVGDWLFHGDTIRTIEKGKAEIFFTNENKTLYEMKKLHWITLGKNSEICLAEYLETRESILGHLLFTYGEMRFTLHDVEPYVRVQIIIETQITQGGIRGTDVAILSDPANEKITYYLREGIIDIKQPETGETVTLTAGQILEISNGQMRPVSTLTSTVWDSLIEEIGVTIAVIPDWVKNNAGWWADDQIEDQDFAQGIQYLISEGIMTIPETTQAETTGDTQGIPSWVKNNAGWWADGQITDDDFVKGIQYLVGQGIIRV